MITNPTPRRLIIHRLTGHQFKGQDFTYHLNGRSVCFHGTNGAGKTTVADAVTYLFDGKNLEGSSTFDIKTIDKDGHTLHGLSHWVEMELEVDGKRHTLRKTYTEIWNRVKGSTKKVFGGHHTACTFNGIDLNMGDYQRELEKLVPAALFRLLATPQGFHRLNWKDQRQRLLHLCGHIQPAEVIARHPRLAPIAQALADLTMEQLLSRTRGILTKTRDELKQFPARTEEVQRTVPGELLSPDALAAIEEKLAAAANTEKEARRQLRENGADQAIRALTADIAARRQAADEAAARHQALQRQLAALEEDTAADETATAALRADWETENARIFDHPDTCTCALCGQHIPETQRRAAREQALALFETQKRQALDAITRRGKALAASLAEKTARRTALRTQVQQAADALPALDHLAALEAELAARIEHRQAEETSLEDHLREAEAQVDRLRSLLQHSQSAQAAHQRLAELEERRTALKATLEEHVAFLSALEAYTRAQAELLQEKVNHHFQLARFRLFRPLVNGELEECCEVLGRGVPYASLNSGSCLLVSLDIIRTLSRHYGVTLPILIENRESYVHLPPMDHQLISLVVSAPDAVLRITPDPQQPLNDSQALSETSDPLTAPTAFPEGQNAEKPPLNATDTPGEERLHGPGF